VWHDERIGGNAAGFAAPEDSSAIGARSCCCGERAIRLTCARATATKRTPREAANNARNG